jgi:hypothetical protein
VKHQQASVTGSTSCQRSRRSDRPSSRRRLLGALASLALLLALVLIPASASAIEAHLPLAFSPITGTGFERNQAYSSDSGVAVDESNGNVFLTGFESEENKGLTKVFGADGGVPTGVASPFQVGVENPAYFGEDIFGVGVDNSLTSSSRGALYVTPVNLFHRVIRKFIHNPETEEYELAATLASLNPQFELPQKAPEPLGVTVDSQGDVFVAEAGQQYKSDGTQVVGEFSPTGTLLARIDVGASVGRPGDVAVDGAGDLFVMAAHFGEKPAGSVYKYPANGAGEIEEGEFTQVLAQGATGIAVDRGANRLYVAMGNHVDQYDATTLVKQAQFGAGAPTATANALTSTGGLTVNSASGRIYVADHVAGKVNLAVFGPSVNVPGVGVGTATNVKPKKATLHNAVNDGGEAVTECTFEYGTTKSYGSSAPCEGALPEDNSDHPVSAAISGLTPNGATYHYRVVAKTAAHTYTSLDESFTTTDSATVTATNITGAKATFEGNVLPEGTAVTECQFEWGPTTSYANPPLPCEGAIPADEGEHAVTATLAHLIPNGTEYHYRIAIDGASGPFKSLDKTFKTLTTFITKPAAPIGATTATLNATVKPEEDPLTECRFEYGITASYGASAPCNPPFGSIPADSEVHPVSAAIGELAPNAKYHFRLVAANANGTILGADETLTTLGPPLIEEEDAGQVEPTTATLFTQVNPRGFNTTYHFEYGTTAGSYDHRLPAESELSAGEGTSAVKETAPLGGLTEDTTYHYRIVAVNGSGSTEGPDQTFTTARANSSCPNAAIRAEQGSEALALPDCRALEQVNPSRKENQYAKEPQLSADGNRVLFYSLAALGGSPGNLSYSGDPYVASRGAGGWSTQPTSPPPPLTRGWGGTAEAKSYTPDFSEWFQLATDERGAQLGQGTAYRAGLGGLFESLSPLLVPVGDPKAADIEDNELQGASADRSHLYFSPRAFGGAAGVAYLPGDLEPTGAGALSNTYIAQPGPGGEPSLALMARDKDGKAWGGNCGAWVGGNVPGTFGPDGHNQGAVSADGARTYFSTRPAQPEGEPCDSAHRKRIMVRTETEAGPEIEELFSPECSRLAPPCDSTDGDDHYQGASVDQSKVYLTSNRQLADSDLDTGAECSAEIGKSAGCDLYLWSAVPDGEGHHLIQASAGDSTDPTTGAGAHVLGVTGISGDGSHAYFVATGILTTSPNPVGARAEAGQPNLYLYERDAEYPAGRTVFLGRLDPGDTGNEGNLWGGLGGWQNAAYPVPVTGTDAEGHQIGGDGGTLIFETRAALSGEDADGAHLDAYRYDAGSGALQCISCAPGGDDGAALNLAPRGGNALGTDFAEQGRWASEDGRTVVFKTKEGLLPADTNGLLDSYIWRDSQLALLPGTEDAGGLGGGLGDTPVLSHDGTTVAFTSFEQLLPPDGDSAIDTYVAPALGGYQVSPPAHICVHEECQEPFSGRPGDQRAASEAPGAGNPREPEKPAPCKKGFARRHGKCVKKPKAHHRKRSHKRAEHHDRRAAK